MTENEKRILKAVVEHHDGLLSPADLINGIAKRDKRSVENLVANGYIEEVPREHPDIRGGYYTINFYRATGKGLLKFAPWHKRIWMSVKGDVRTVLISTITALITTLVVIFLEKILRSWSVSF
ncbi:MAG: hypothetical protein Q8Q46_00640 [Candidatus Giovannonibacteria bacterium]|nr:hypothetical protein [Candidatus Giovannonibacteria bacterium]